MASEQLEFEDLERLMSKMDFVPGLPDDPRELPETRYQVLAGTVYTLVRWPTGSTARGSMTLDEFIARIGPERGITVREGWYDETYKYLGDVPGFRA